MSQPEKDLIRKELLELGHKIKKIFKVLHRVTKELLPVLYIDLVKPKLNNREIFNVKYLNYYVVYFQVPCIKREVPPYKRCQRFGHTFDFCNRLFRCVKCSDSHAT